MGEAGPILDRSSAVISGPDRDNGQTDPRVAPTYEYLWTLGHVEGIPGEKKRSRRNRFRPWNKPMARAVNGVNVCLDFGEMDGWRISEPIGTVKYMSPALKTKKVSEQISEKLQTASQVTALTPGGAAISKWMEAAGKLEATSLPQTKGFEWSIAASTVVIDDKLRYRISWTIPKNMFNSLGGRLTGGLAVIFIDASSAAAISSDSPKTIRQGPQGKLYLTAEISHWSTEEHNLFKNVKSRMPHTRTLVIPDGEPVDLTLNFEWPTKGIH